MIIIIIVVSISIVSQTICLEQKPECGQTNRADICMQKLLLIGDPKFKFAENREEMEVFCKNITRYENCIKDYAKNCLETLPRQVTALLAYGVAKTNKAVCRSQRRKDIYISSSGCYNHIKPLIDICMREYIDSYLCSENHNDTKIQLALLCCHHNLFKDCVLKNLTKAFPKICNYKDHIEMERAIDGYAMDSHSLLCGEYSEDSDKCDAIIAQTPPKLSSQKRPKSLLPPLIRILGSLE